MVPAVTRRNSPGIPYGIYAGAARVTAELREARVKRGRSPVGGARELWEDFRAGDVSGRCGLEEACKELAALEPDLPEFRVFR